MEVNILPFLKKKEASSSGLIVETRSSPKPPESASGSGSEAIEACAMELIIAIHLKDTKKVAEVLKHLFEILESQPHSEEGSY